MCLGAIYWARPAKMYFACNTKTRQISVLTINFIYEEIERPIEERKIITR